MLKFIINLMSIKLERPGHLLYRAVRLDNSLRTNGPVESTDFEAIDGAKMY